MENTTHLIKACLVNQRIDRLTWGNLCFLFHYTNAFKGYPSGLFSYCVSWCWANTISEAPGQPVATVKKIFKNGPAI